MDLIVTKSVARFARNVKESLAYVRKLKLLGVGVMFEKEGINTLAMGDEMLLNTFSAIAQEESQAISQNQRLSIVKRMERGEYVCSNAAYGFRLIDKELQIFEPEAEVVRWIFQAYLAGWSTAEISRDLNLREVPSKYGNKGTWAPTKITYILSNVVLEVAGTETTFRTTWECARPNAIVTVVALYDDAQILPLPEMYGKNLTFKTGGVDGCNCKETLQLIAEGKIDTTPLITHTYALKDIADAYEVFESKKDGVIKIAVEC